MEVSNLTSQHWFGIACDLRIFATKGASRDKMAACSNSCFLVFSFACLKSLAKFSLFVLDIFLSGMAFYFKAFFSFIPLSFYLPSICMYVRTQNYVKILFEFCDVKQSRK